ncbi:MAG: PAS domain S-box protein, partial [Methanobacteriota archaeon]
MILNDYIQLEDQIARENMYRAESAITEQIATIDSVALDWAAWDDTYEFIEDRNEHYVEVNLVDETLANLRLNFMVFVNSSGGIVSGKAYDLQEGTAIELPPGLEEHLAFGEPLTSHDSPDSACNGILMLPGGPVLVASRPIVTSDAQGPVRGSVVFGRYLDQVEIERISGIIHHDLQIYAIGDPAIPSEYPSATATPLGTSVVFIQPVSADAIAGYITPADLYGNSAFVLRTDMTRDIYSQGQASVFFMLISIFGTGLLFGIVTLGVLEKFVLKRLYSLDRDVHRIGASGDLASRVRVEGDDEFSHLATSINGMVSALESTKNNLLEVEKRYHAVVEDQTELISRFLPDGTHVFVNEAYCRYFGKRKEEIIGHRFVPDLPEADRQRIKEHFAALSPNVPVLTIEHRIVMPDGEIRWQQWTDRAFFDRSGRIVEYQSVGRDVTDRKHAEEEIQRSYQRLSDILESLPDGIFVIDKEKRVIAWNHALEEMTGVKKQGILYKGEA